MSGASLLALIAVLALTVLQSVDAAASLKPGDRLCRFYSGMTKKCQSKCQSLTMDEMTAISKKRKGGANVVGVAEINDSHLDPILFVKCTDEPRVSSWNAGQEFMAFAAAKDSTAYMQANVYVGACLFQKDKKHSWNCRGCERPLSDTNEPGKQSSNTVTRSCFISGEDGYKTFYAKGWQQTGDDESTLSISH